MILPQYTFSPIVVIRSLRTVPADHVSMVKYRYVYCIRFDPPRHATTQFLAWLCASRSPTRTYGHVSGVRFVSFSLASFACFAPSSPTPEFKPSQQANIWMSKRRYLHSYQLHQRSRVIVDVPTFPHIVRSIVQVLQQRHQFLCHCCAA